MQETIERLKKLALDNYENGGDSMVECWDDNNYRSFIERNGIDRAEQELLLTMELYKDRQKDIQSTIF